MKRLSELSVGESAYIERIEPCPLKQRLLELGFLGQVRCIARAPLDGPTAYLIRGALIALRKKDAAFVRIISEHPSSDVPLQ